jgi:hypothetical protein
MPNSFSARRAPFSISMKNGLVSVFMTSPIWRAGGAATTGAEAGAATVVTLGPLDWPQASMPKPNTAEENKGINFMDDSRVLLVDPAPPS